MSISLEKFKIGNFKKGRNSRDRHPVLLFLRKKQRAYKVSEIVKIISIKEDTCRSMLRMLEKDKLVEHKVPYFAIKQDNPKKVNKKPVKRRPTSSRRIRK